MKIPVHIAFIMDGNRRWAREKGLPISAGHTKATQILEPLITHAKNRGVKYVTFWAFSTENWNRTPTEVKLLMNVFRRFFKSSSIEKLKKNDVKIQVLGDYTKFPKDIVKDIEDLLEETKNHKSIVVNMALNYGGRVEMLRAVNTLLQEGKKEVDAETFSTYLFTAGQPEPDIIVRTGGEQRMSGFMPWQSVYAEYFFPTFYFPDFTGEKLDEVIKEYNDRERRFGK